MPGTSKAKNKRGVEINFVEDTHKYFTVVDGKEVRYVSGTTFVGKFFPKFDPDGSITERCALKEGITVEEIRRRWKEKGEKSCIYGTRVHESMEDCLLGRPLRNTPNDDREKTVFETAKSLSTKILNEMDVLGVEKIIFDEDIRVAGTIDLLARSKKNGKIYILDYKTNEDLEIDNRFNKFALPPITNVPNTKYGHYQMQLNLYRHILMNSGYVDDGEDVRMCLIHMTENGSKVVPVPKREKEISDMIRDFKGDANEYFD